ncbi:MAG: alpha/beta fold hydrolase [Acidobacteria bacterium]|nr:alpha/beta fold hydrolase [Acidobacteriota bacterium]
MSESTSPVIFHRGMQSAERPIWHEAMLGLDWLALRTSPVFYGLGVPRGNGSAVVVVPGFMGTDHYLWEMNLWLRRIGYKAYMSGIGWNADCLEVKAQKLIETIERAASETGGKVHLIGHSLGGVLSRSAAARRPEKIASVISLGSPFRGVASHPLVLATANKVRERIRVKTEGREPDCYTGFCSCEAVARLQIAFPDSVPNTAVFTKKDGIVDWRYCINDDPSANVEVQGTHVGLAFNHQVYKVIAERLYSATSF